MKVVKKTKDYIIYQKGSGRYAVKGADKKWINAEEKIKRLYNKLPNFQARAILYQRLLLSDDPINKVNLAMKMKSLFRKDKIENRC